MRPLRTIHYEFLRALAEREMTCDEMHKHIDGKSWPVVFRRGLAEWVRPDGYGCASGCRITELGVAVLRAMDAVEAAILIEARG